MNSYAYLVSLAIIALLYSHFPILTKIVVGSVVAAFVFYYDYVTKKEAEEIRKQVEKQETPKEIIDAVLYDHDHMF